MHKPPNNPNEFKNRSSEEDANDGRTFKSLISIQITFFASNHNPIGAGVYVGLPYVLESPVPQIQFSKLLVGCSSRYNCAKMEKKLKNWNLCLQKSSAVVSGLSSDHLEHLGCASLHKIVKKNFGLI